MPTSPYLTNGTPNEQELLESIVNESVYQRGTNFFYIPRTLIGKDEILGEDRLSQFKEAYPIEMYLENSTGFDGAGMFIQKFGLMIEQTATLTVGKRRWNQLVGQFGTTIIPNRPNEGDLIYFPLANSLFEIKFVDALDPFFQLGKRYVYKLHIELFQYASEVINTGIDEIDTFESLKTFDTTKQNDVDTPQSYGDNNKFKDEGNSVIFDTNNPFGEIVLSPNKRLSLSDTITSIDAVVIE
jgi:hypothetical protein